MIVPYLIYDYDLWSFNIFEYSRVLTPLFCVSLFCLGSLLLLVNKTSILIGGKEPATRLFKLFMNGLLFILIVNFPIKWPWTGWCVIAMEPNKKDLWFFFFSFTGNGLKLDCPSPEEWKKIIIIILTRKDNNSK